MQGSRARPVATRRRMSGVSLIELMIAITLGLMVLAALASIFANSSRTRAELDRNSRQIENGRFALDLITSEIRLAGFYGELDPGSVGPPPALMDPCSVNPVDWTAAIQLHIQGYDNGAAIPVDCAFPNLKPNTDIVAVRRVAACEAGINGCPAVQVGAPYLQVTKCDAEILTPYKLGLQGTVGFTLHNRGPGGTCGTLAGMRQYFVRMFYISNDNGETPPVAIPTLKRRDFNGAGFDDVPLVEGIEQLNFEYGIDTDGDSIPNVYVADPTNYVCGGCTAVSNWKNVVTVRVYLLARNIDPSPNFVDNKTYTLGKDAAGVDITVTPADSYHRHVYTSLVRIVNPAQRKETPP
jgi:type IV pilus assembly protein PilW